MNPLDQTLYDLAGEMLESLAFMLLMPEDDPDASEPDWVAGRVCFDGPFEGALFLRVPESMLTPLAANMLGLDPCEEPAREIQLDAFKEVLNVVCGNALPAIAGRQAVFNVQAPEVLEDSSLPETQGAHGRIAHARLQLDEGSAELALYAPEQVTATTTA